MAAAMLDGLPAGSLVFMGGVFALSAGLVIRRAPWRRFIDEPALIHLFIATVLCLSALWQLRAGTAPGLALHFLGISTLTLMFGWALALVAAALALLGSALVWGAPLASLPMDVLVVAVLPVAVCWWLYRLVMRYLPAHLFVYLYLCGFLGGLLSTVVSVFAVAGLLGLSGVYAPDRLMRDYLTYLPLLAFPEGLLNGMLLTALVALRPTWLATYSDARYLKGK
ncbi:energy-coupling factor ABC transporter permease [Acidihalobacter yilgarnensis]|nr:energy-coupling factor ABC transporter permease [Acidihalobacter yilgarnensis]